MNIENYLNKVVNIDDIQGLVIDIEQLDDSGNVVVILESLDIEEDARYMAIPVHRDYIQLVAIH